MKLHEGLVLEFGLRKLNPAQPKMTETVVEGSLD